MDNTNMSPASADVLAAFQHNAQQVDQDDDTFSQSDGGITAPGPPDRGVGNMTPERMDTGADHFRFPTADPETLEMVKLSNQIKVSEHVIDDLLRPKIVRNHEDDVAINELFNDINYDSGTGFISDPKATQSVQSIVRQAEAAMDSAGAVDEGYRDLVEVLKKEHSLRLEMEMRANVLAQNTLATKKKLEDAKLLLQSIRDSKVETDVHQHMSELPDMEFDEPPHLPGGPARLPVYEPQGDDDPQGDDEAPASAPHIGLGGGGKKRKKYSKKRKSSKKKKYSKKKRKYSRKYSRKYKR